MSVHYKQATQSSELEQILTLQRHNMEEAVSETEAREQGFVTVHHTLELLQDMNNPHGHILAVDEQNQVIGYCLVMLKQMGQRIPELTSLINKIDKIDYNGAPLHLADYCIMGQVCVARPFRGKGVFKGLYLKMKDALADHFDFIVTSIAKRNTRSVKAHCNVGFEIIDEYMDDQDDWYVVLWTIK